MIVERFALNPMGTNTYVIAAPSGDAYIVDPCATDMAPMVAYIQDHALRVKAIVNTHCHFDHVLGNEAMRTLYRVPLWLHRLELTNLKESPQRAQKWLGIQVETRDPDAFIEDGDVLELGQGTDAVRLQILLTPGHSPGGICLYDRRAGILFSGDTLFAGTVGRTDLPGSDPEALMVSLREKLWPLPDETVVYPGHEDDTTIAEERMANPYFHF